MPNPTYSPHPKKRALAGVVLGGGVLPILQFVLWRVFTRMPSGGQSMGGPVGHLLGPSEFLPPLSASLAVLVAYAGGGWTGLAAYSAVALTGSVLFGAPLVAVATLFSVLFWPVLGFAVRP